MPRIGKTKTLRDLVGAADDFETVEGVSIERIRMEGV